nr:Tau-tubulin kinase 2 [Polyrhizophydium stewartii]
MTGNRHVAIKLESPQCKKPVLKLEVSIIQRMQASPYACSFVAYGRFIPPLAADDALGSQEETQSLTYSFMVMELLGPNVSDLRKKAGGKFSMATTALLARQMVRAIEAIHSIGFLHRDIKPGNFCIAPPKSEHVDAHNRPRCFLIDFGLSRRYLSTSGKVREELCRADDLWSLFYMVVEFLTGTLPWKGKEKDRIGTLKHAWTNAGLVSGQPVQMLDLYAYITSLSYTTKPDYDYICSLFDDMFRDSDQMPAAAAAGFNATMHSHMIIGGEFGDLSNNFGQAGMSGIFLKCDIGEAGPHDHDDARDAEFEDDHRGCEPDEDDGDDDQVLVDEGDDAIGQVAVEHKQQLSESMSQGLPSHSSAARMLTAEQQSGQMSIPLGTNNRRADLRGAVECNGNSGDSAARDRSGSLFAEYDQFSTRAVVDVVTGSAALRTQVERVYALVGHGNAGFSAARTPGIALCLLLNHRRDPQRDRDPVDDSPGQHLTFSVIRCNGHDHATSVRLYGVQLDE